MCDSNVKISMKFGNNNLKNILMDEFRVFVYLCICMYVMS